MAITRIEAADREQRPWQTVVLPVAGWTIAAAILIVLALANPINGDEDLFVAPAAVPGSAHIYVDFLFLHMPLQAELTRIFAPLFRGHAFIALRVAMAIMGLALLGVVYAGQRAIGVERRPAVICTALLACTYSFQFSSGVVRNDIMSALLSSAGIVAALVALRRKPHAAASWGAAGLLFSAASAVRISAAFPAAAAGLFLIGEVVRRRVSPVGLAAFAIGAAIGLGPCLPAWLAAPHAFIYSVLTYPSAGNLYWFVTTGRQAIVSPAANVVITAGALAVGPGLGALLAATRWWARREGAAKQTNRCAVFLDILIVAGLIAALLPTPSNFQEAMSFLPQLFIRLGLEIPRLLASKDRIERLAVRLMVFGAVAGCGYGLFVVARPGKEPWPALAVTEQAHAIGDRLRGVGADGFISTFAAHLVLDSNYPLDPRFSSGVFLYRSAPLVSADRLDRLHGIGPQNLPQALDRVPPGAIIVGGSIMDRQLRGYALDHHYLREMNLPDGYELYVRRPG